MKLTIVNLSATTRPLNRNHMRKFTYKLILALCVGCRSYEGIVTKQYYEPPQTIVHTDTEGRGGKPRHDNADYCVEVAPVQQAYWKMRRQPVPLTKLYLDSARWRSVRVGDTITYTRPDQRDRVCSGSPPGGSPPCRVGRVHGGPEGS